MLTNNAYVEVEAEGNVATFELGDGLSYGSALEKRYVVGGRGQYIRQASRIAPFDITIDDADAERAGYWIDGRAGSWEITLEFTTGAEGESIRWGDGSNDDRLDASGEGVPALHRLQVLQYWLARTRSDSAGKTRVHWGNWTDGNVSGVTGVSAGAYNQPMSVAVSQTDVSKAPDDPSAVTGTLTVERVALLPDAIPSSADDAIEQITQSLGGIPDH